MFSLVERHRCVCHEHRAPRSDKLVKHPWLQKSHSAPNRRFPRLYCSQCVDKADLPASWWVGATSELSGALPPAQAASDHPASGRGQDRIGPIEGRQSVGEMTASMLADLEPLMLAHGVDVYAAGHVHAYESVFPTRAGAPTQLNFSQPRAPVHIVTGNGGPPTINWFSNKTGNATFPAWPSTGWRGQLARAIRQRFGQLVNLSCTSAMLSLSVETKWVVTHFRMIRVH